MRKSPPATSERSSRTCWLRLTQSRLLPGAADAHRIGRRVQCYAVDAFRRIAALNRVLDDKAAAARYDKLAERIQKNFVTQFWVQDHFAEYHHPQRGLIANHGLADVDWAALATGITTAEQRAVLWPQLKTEGRFHYGGMPTGIATRPETYEPWEFTHPDRHDLPAMGGVWYLEAWTRAQLGLLTLKEWESGVRKFHAHRAQHVGVGESPSPRR
jgi:hypothetical protein